MPETAMPETALPKTLHVVNHPLILHKLSLMRDKHTPSAVFRQLLREISLLLAYEVARDLPVTMHTIETPLAEMQAPILKGKKLVVVSILRAGKACSKACSISCHRPVSAISGSIAIPLRCSRSSIT